VGASRLDLNCASNGQRPLSPSNLAEQSSVRGVLRKPVNLVCWLCRHGGGPITVMMRKSGDVGAASRSSADRFGSMAELPLFGRPTVMRRSNCRPPGDRRR
jgi:hypothetical protein